MLQMPVGRFGLFPPGHGASVSGWEQFLRPRRAGSENSGPREMSGAWAEPWFAAEGTLWVSAAGHRMAETLAPSVGHSCRCWLRPAWVTSYEKSLDVSDDFKTQ